MTAPDVLAVNPLDVPLGAADQGDDRRRSALSHVPDGDGRAGIGRRHSGHRGGLGPGCRVALRFCRGSDAVLLRGYPEAMAGARDEGRNPYEGVYVTSWPDVRPWLADRFAGAPPVGNCDE